MKGIVFFTLRHVRSLVLVSAVVLFGPLPASGQRVPTPDTQRDSGPALSTLTGLLSTDAEIDKEIDRIKAQGEKLASEKAAAGAAPASFSAQSLGASPDELRQQERITSELVIDLDRQIDALKELKEIKKDNASYEVERKSWKGFGEKPPFAIAFLDDIRDSLLSQRLALSSFELRLSLARTYFKRFDDALTKSGKELRLAGERSAKSARTSQEQRSRWLLDLARLQNNRNEAGLVLAELQRLTYETGAAGKRLQIAFLEEKLRIAEASSPLSKEDLEKKLSELDSQRTALEAELVKAQKTEAEGRRRLDTVRSALGGLPEAGRAKAPSEEQRRILGLDFEAEQAFVETSRLKVSELKARIQFANAAEKLWQDRYWLTRKPDLKEIREKRAQLTEDRARLAFLRKFAESSLSSWMNLLKNQKGRIAALEKNDPAMKTQELILRTYEERQNIALRLIEGLGRFERLSDRVNDELTRRIDEASIVSRAKEGVQVAYSFAKKIWNTELYVATETTVVEDRTIVKPVSVTIGKVVDALIILVIGTWIAGKISKAIQWALTRRLQWPKRRAEPVGKIIFGMMFVGVSVISLVSVNIPLAVFTFLGGALAIGLGFGGQHLINNFISGLILLFDRSIRVGDIIEVDGQGGKVTAIGMRNSRVHRFDGVNLLIPNSQFVQQKVTNWTLTDRKIRYAVTVGVAYGSPTRETERVLMKAIETHPMVLQDPPPTVLFEQFGDSALVFTGYFWMELASNRDNRLAVGEIRHTIDELLREAGIVIAFPQRDVHLDPSGPLEVKVLFSDKEKKKS